MFAFGQGWYEPTSIRAGAKSVLKRAVWYLVAGITRGLRAQ